MQIPDAVIDKLNTIGIRPTEYLEFVSKMVDEVSDSKSADLKHVRGQALRELKVFLEKYDPGNIYGRLEKVVMTDGHVRWLCPEHASKHHFIGDRIAKPNSELPLPPIIPPVCTPPPGMGSLLDLKVVLLGSGGCNKSALSVQYVQGVFVAKYDPTIEDSYRVQREIDGKQVMLEILDTAGTEQFTAMRDLYMKNGQGFILCCNLKALSTLNDLPDLREQILRVKDCDSVPLVIAGIALKAKHEQKRAWTVETGEEMAKKMDAVYIEVICRENVNVDLCFTTLVRKIFSSLEVRPTAQKKASGVKKLFGGTKSSTSPSSAPDTPGIVDKTTWQTAIHQASKANDLEKLSALLVKETKLINAQDYYLRTALHYACSTPNALPMIKLLLEAGASLQAKDSLMNTPFHTFASGTKADLATWEYLCRHGANTISNFDFFFAGNIRKSNPFNLLKSQNAQVHEFIAVLGNKLSIVADPVNFVVSALDLKSLPASVTTVTPIVSLDLSQNLLSSLPAEITSLTRLSKLDLSGNNFAEPGIPASISTLPLVSIRANVNKFKSIPEQILMHTLEYLQMNRNIIDNVSDFIGKATSLKTLSLENNQIQAVSDQLTRLGKLIELNVSTNKLSSFPSTLTMPSLTSLNLANNELTTAPVLSPSLETINLFNNKLTAVSVPINNKLTSLNLCKNQIPSLSQETLGSPINVRTLLLANNNVRFISPFVSKMIKLELLDLSSNSISAFSPEICLIPTLTELNMSDNALTSVPLEIGKLSNLKRINLRNNASIITLPPQFGQLKLTSLIVNGTGIAKFPSTMLHLKNTLVILDVNKANLPANLHPSKIAEVVEHMCK